MLYNIYYNRMSGISFDILKLYSVKEDDCWKYTNSLSDKILIFTQNCIRGNRPGNYIQLNQWYNNDIENVKYNLYYFIDDDDMIHLSAIPQ